METRSFLELFFNDTSNPCYFTEMDTYNLAFVNKMMEKKIRAYDDVVGQKCHKVLHNLDTPCNFCPMSSLKDSQFIEQRIFNEVTRSYHRANSTMITVNDTKLCACKYFVAFQQERREVIPYDKAIETCKTILESGTAETATKELFELLGKFYLCERSFTYEMNPEKQVVESGFTWAKSEQIPLMPEISDLAVVQELLQWLDQLNGEILEINASSSLDPNSMQARLLAMHGVKNMTVHPLRSRLGKVNGFLGLSNRKTIKFDPRLLQIVARFTEGSSKQHLINELTHASELDEQTGFFNRKKYMELIRDVSETPPLSMGVLFVHLPNLRSINEKLGFAAGNQLIDQCTDILRERFSEDFYRITGDEFLCFFPDCTEGDLFQRVTSLDEDLAQRNPPIMEVGCAWGTQNYNVLQLVSEADENIRS